MTYVSSWDKFKLLLWKNWVLQWNQKLQLFVELVLPAVFTLLLVLVRTLVSADYKGVTEYKPINISNLDLFKKSIVRGYAMRYFLGNSASSDKIKLQQLAKKVNMSLMYSPKNALLDGIVKKASENLQLQYYACTNSSEMEYRLIDENALAGVQFDDSWSNLQNYPMQLSYALRFPSELRTSLKSFPVTWLTMKLFLPFDMSGPRNMEDEDGGMPVGYLREGFLPVQHAISMAYIELASNRSDFPYIAMQRFPYPEYIFDPLLEGLSSMMSLIILLSFIYPCTSIVKYITAEKEKQLKEVMKIMGLNNWIHWTAWFVKSFIMLGISAMLITILIKIHWSQNVAVLTHSDWSVLLFFMWMYCAASICFCFMVATMFSRASTAAAVTGLVWFLAYVPFSFSAQDYDGLSLSAKLGWSLISNSAMGFAVKLILGHEGNGEGLQWSNLFQPINVDDNLTVGHIIIMMLVSCALYMLICLYVEQIFPGDYGVPRKWNFPFTMEYWFNEKEYIGIDDIPHDYTDRQNSEAFELQTTGKHVGIQVRNLRKQFGNKLAVKGLSINMYEDEITVLLGHNGAGKTTTISMLTGMFPPSAGTAIINGSDIRTNLDGARMSLGICPQHNVLFDDLSVMNHLIFFSRLKGLKGTAIDKEIEKYLKLIQLEDKRNVPSKNLSGGMKRKLSICCALCGNTKVVLCDEPSSGMDPAARRQLWDLLQSEKIGRTVLLTTHFMDEADVLGDRIAIMCDGELKCHGTSFFLKKKFGSGYKLICVKREGCNTKEVTSLLQKYIPDITIDSDIGAELSYLLPDSYSNVFESMFSELEESSDELHLNGYGVGITSLEEVFMKVGAENGENGVQEAKPAMINNNTDYPDYDKESITNDNLFSENQRLLGGFSLLANQWKAMLFKKFLYTYRNKVLFVLQNMMPIIFVSLTVLIVQNSGTFYALQPMTFDLTQYPVATSVLEVSQDVTSDSVAGNIAKCYKNIATSYGDSYSLEETGDKTFRNYILNLGPKMQVRINSRYIAAASIYNDNITARLNNQPLHTAPLTVNLVHNALLRAVKNESYGIHVTNYPLPYTTQTILAQLNQGNNLGTQLASNLCFCFSFVSAFYTLYAIKERESRSKLLQLVAGVKVWIFWLSQYLWDYLTFIITSIIIIITLAVFHQEGYDSFAELMRYFLVLITFGFTVLPFTYLLAMFFTEPATGFARVSIINIFTGMALFMVVLVMSLEIFNTKGAADILTWIFRMFPHFSLGMSLNKLFINGATRRACSNHILEAIPNVLRCQFVPQCCESTPYFDWHEPGVAPELVFMAGSGVLFFLIIIVGEYELLSDLIHKIKLKILPPPAAPELTYIDDDVENEKARIRNMSIRDIQTQNLVLDNVTKYYGKFLAVNRISLCVKPEECFGLLGVNGAGKTTTFKMMTGDEHITYGSAYVCGYNLNDGMNKVYKEIGYCPQFDALLDDFTGRETIKIFSLIRGVNKYHVDMLTEQLAASFGFKRHLDKFTKAYSGGNKRKLSTAIAVIGSPSVIYLDEPTSGMDPAARRQLWNMVCRLRDSGKSIVLTSHSMEECEALCTRLAIMVNGELKCIGSTQHLKNKFSKGLILKIKVKPRKQLYSEGEFNGSFNSIREFSAQVPQYDVTLIKEFVEKEFHQAVLQEEYQGMLTFYIPLSSIKWSKIFGLMERNRFELNVEDYSISQTTLEEIFLDFAKHQREEVQQTS